MFVGTPMPVSAPVPEPHAEPLPPSPVAPRPSSLAALEAELARELMESGVVVRGHDIARVVGLMAGADVAWENDAPEESENAS